MDRVQVIDLLGVGVIPPNTMVATQTEQVSDAQSRRSQKVGLDSQPIAIAARHLHNRLNTVS
jgi:hypothetical protein